MPKKERNINPVTAHTKSLKRKEVKKSKATISQARAEKLSQRNPVRIQAQIDELTNLRAAQGGQFKVPRNQQQLAKLERDLIAVQKARERLGKTPAGDGKSGEQQKERRGNVLGKRKRDDGDNKSRKDGGGDQSRDTDDDVADIPMPTDTENMPPIPRRRKDVSSNPQSQSQSQNQSQDNIPAAQPTVVTVASKVVYSAAPQLRDLTKEAVARFVPAAVAAKIATVKATSGKLLEPEEAEALVKGGYIAPTVSSIHKPDSIMDEEERKFRMEIMHEADANITDNDDQGQVDNDPPKPKTQSRAVEIEEVSDDDI